MIGPCAQLRCQDATFRCRCISAVLKRVALGSAKTHTIVRLSVGAHTAAQVLYRLEASYVNSCTLGLVLHISLAVTCVVSNRCVTETCKLHVATTVHRQTLPLPHTFNHTRAACHYSIHPSTRSTRLHQPPMATTINSTKSNSAGDPGLSLWLVPPKGSHTYNVLTKAITDMVPDEMGASDSAPEFEPHITLTSRIPRNSVTPDPQKWLDAIELPEVSSVEVRWHELAVGDAYYKKLFVRCKRTDSLLQLASSCRIFSSATIDGAQYDPHVSLL